MLDEKDLLRVFRDLKVTIVEGGARIVDGRRRRVAGCPTRLVDDRFRRGGTSVRTPPIKAPQPVPSSAKNWRYCREKRRSRTVAGAQRRSRRLGVVG